MRDMPNSAFRLRRRRTWPDKPDDFEARVGDSENCRIYLFMGGEPPFAGRWCWVANRCVSLGSGYADTAKEAALEAERTFFA